MEQQNEKWLSLLEVSKKRQGRCYCLVTMPYHGVVYARAQIPAKSVSHLITHYIHVHRKDENNSDLGILYPCLETSLVFRRNPNSRFDSLIVGPRDFTRHGEYVTNDTEYFVVLLSQVGGNALLPYHQQELTNSSLALSAVFPKWADELSERINTVDTTTDKIGIFETFLHEHLHELKPIDDERLNGISNISRTADYKKHLKYVKDLNCTERHVRRLFLRYTGMPPKNFFQIMRWQSAIKIMAANPSCNLADVAYSLGYYDQTHFINDFKTFFQDTPKRFIQKFLKPSLLPLQNNSPNNI